MLKKIFESKKINNTIDKFANIFLFVEYFSTVVFGYIYFFKVLTFLNVLLILVLAGLTFLFFKIFLNLWLDDTKKFKELSFASLSIVIALIVFLFNFLYTQKENFENIQNTNYFNCLIASQNIHPNSEPKIFIPFNIENYENNYNLTKRTFNNLSFFENFLVLLKKSNTYTANFNNISSSTIKEKIINTNQAIEKLCGMETMKK